MSDEYKARLKELVDSRDDQMIEAFDRPVLRVSSEFFSLCAPILTSVANSGIMFVSEE